MLATVARLSRKWATALIIPLLLFYAAVTGLHVSSVRAAVMTSILLGGFFFERKVFVLNSLAAAAFFLLCWNTNELFSTGFQLSFAVVGAIVLFADPLFGFLQTLGRARSFLPRIFATWPASLDALWFRMALPWQPLFRSQPGSVRCHSSSGIFISLRRFHCSRTCWSFRLPSSFSRSRCSRFCRRRCCRGSLSFSIMPTGFWRSLFSGSCNLFAQVPGGHFYVERPHWSENDIAKDHGAGPRRGRGCSSADGRRGLAVRLRERADLRTRGSRVLALGGVNRLDGLLLTHGDSLHIGGAAELLHDFPRVRLIDNPAPDRSSYSSTIAAPLPTNAEIKPDHLAAGDSFRLSRDVTAHVLFPPRVFLASHSGRSDLCHPAVHCAIDVDFVHVR